MAGIIKAGQWQNHPAEQQPAAVHWAEMPAHAVGMAAVERQAAEILAAARRDAEQIRRQAAQQGKADALHEAQQLAQRELQAQLKTLLPAIQKAVFDFQQMRQQWLDQWQKNAIRLACTIAQHIMRREVTQQPDIPLTLIRESLELASGWNPVTVELHPEDLQALGEQLQELASQWGRTVQVQFAANAEIEKGSCRLVGAWGEIDQRWSAQLERVQEELIG
jgi:flagellar assembly protein FliH